MAVLKACISGGKKNISSSLCKKLANHTIWPWISSVLFCAWDPSKFEAYRGNNNNTNKKKKKVLCSLCKIQKEEWVIPSLDCWMSKTGKLSPPTWFFFRLGIMEFERGAETDKPTEKGIPVLWVLHCLLLKNVASVARKKSIQHLANATMWTADSLSATGWQCCPYVL